MKIISFLRAKALKYTLLKSHVKSDKMNIREFFFFIRYSFSNSRSIDHNQALSSSSALAKYLIIASIFDIHFFDSNSFIIPSPKNIAQTLSLFLSDEKARILNISAALSIFLLSQDQKNIDSQISIRKSVSSSLSSTYFFTNVFQVLAVASQSIFFISSPKAYCIRPLNSIQDQWKTVL